MILLNIFVVLITAYLFIKLYKKAAGSLSVKKLNLYNISFYYILFFCFIGLSSILLGFREHYLLLKITDNAIFTKGYIIGMYALLVLPIAIIISLKAYGIKNYAAFYNKYISKPVVIEKESYNYIYILCVLSSIVGIVALYYTFATFGTIPLISILSNSSDAGYIRFAISRAFTGNTYIRNLFALQLIPALSYLTYIYFKMTNKYPWKYLFGVLFMLSILCKTYNLEKSPLLIYLLYFYLIDSLLGFTNKLRKIIKFGVAGTTLLIGLYIITGYEGNFFTIYGGPVSRLIFSQIACLFLHIQAFPDIHTYLMGDSFSGFLGGNNIRSGRVVMEIFNPSGVADDVAGVMNTLFVGEAYANFGMIGALISPVIVGIIMGIVPTFFLKQEKNPVNIAIYVSLSTIYASALVGGFVDFVYNIGAIFIVGIFVFIKVVSDNWKLKLKI